MKKYFHLFIVMFIVSVLFSCGPKTNDNTNDDADTTTTAEVSDEVRKQEEIAAKRTQLETARAEKMEQRRLAAIELAKTKPTYKDASGKIVYNKAEIDPSFTGGEDAMRKYLKENLIYPDSARENGIEGTVFVDFIVDEKGKVREVVATEAIGIEVDQSLKDEAIRVVEAMPTWIAGKQRGKAVDTRFSIPISFQSF